MKKKNDVVKIGDFNYKLLLSSKALQLSIKKIALKISSDYKGSNPPVLLVVTNGGMYFGTSLSMALQDINFSHSVDTVRIKRYTGDGQTSTKVKISSEPSINLLGKDVIVIEDLIDEGITMVFLNDYLINKNTKSIQYCVLVEKKAHNKLDFDIKYSIIRNAGPEWLVGFGMDSNFHFRGLRGIYAKVD